MRTVREDPRLPLEFTDPQMRPTLFEVLREFGAAINDAAQERLWLFVHVTATYSAGINDHIILCAPGGTMTVTLPDVKDMRNKRIIVKRTNDTTHTITIATVAGSIDGGGSKTLTTAYELIELYSDGVDYWVMSCCNIGPADPPPQ